MLLLVASGNEQRSTASSAYLMLYVECGVNYPTKTSTIIHTAIYAIREVETHDHDDVVDTAAWN